MPGIVSRAWAVIFFSRYAFKNFSGFTSFYIIIYYFKIKLKNFFLKTILKIPLKKESFLGFKINFFDYTHFTFLFEQIFLAQVYRFRTGEKKPVILDCGANIGMATVFFKYLYPEAKITAVEADPKIYKYLKHNMEINGFSGIKTVNRAIYDRDIELKFNYEKSSLFQPGKKHRKVKSVKFSSLINKNIDFLKMDVEGAELKTIREAERKKKLKKIKEGIIEIHHHLPGCGEVFLPVINSLKKNGFDYQLITFLYYPPFKKGIFQDFLLYVYRPLKDKK